jgi:hypothetical protein
MAFQEKFLSIRLDLVNKYIVGIEIAIFATLIAVVAYGGWHLRTIVYERDEAKAAAESLLKLAEKTEIAATVADDYARKRDAMQPKIQVVRVASEPIIKTLETCSLPADARGVLADAADAADGAAPARDLAHGASAEVAGRKTFTRRFESAQ